MTLPSDDPNATADKSSTEALHAGMLYTSIPFGELRGHAYADGSARRIEMRLIRDSHGLHLVDTNGVLHHSGMPNAQEKIPGGPVLVHFGPQGETSWAFETQQTAQLTELIGPLDDGWLSGLEAWHPRLIAVLALCLLSGFAIWRWGLGALASIAIFFTPASFVEAIDRGNLAAMDRFMSAPSTLTVVEQERVKLVFEDIVAAAPAAPYGAYHLEFRDMEFMGPNAFALPGGTVVITDALIQEFPDENIIAGILGHELAHVSEKHSLKQLYRSLGGYVLVAMMAGDVGPILEEALLEGNVIASLSFSRAHEAEADAIGVGTASRAGYEPAALAAFFEGLHAHGGGEGPTWLSTHPSHEDRVETIKDLAAQN